MTDFKEHLQLNLAYYVRTFLNRNYILTHTVWRRTIIFNAGNMFWSYKNPKFLCVFLKRLISPFFPLFFDANTFKIAVGSRNKPALAAKEKLYHIIGFVLY